MVVIRAKGINQTPRDIVLQDAEHDVARQRNVINIQEIKREFMMKIQQKKVIL